MATRTWVAVEEAFVVIVPLVNVPFGSRFVRVASHEQAETLDENVTV